MPIEHISDLQSFQAAISTPLKLIVVDFHASWCGPCHAIAPIYEQLSNQYATRARFLKVDVDEAEDVARRCGVSAMPTFHFYLRGSKVSEFSGADQTKLQSELERLAPSAADVSFTGAGNRLGDAADAANPAHLPGHAPDHAAGPSAVGVGAGSMRNALAAAAARRFEESQRLKEAERKKWEEQEEQARKEEAEKEDTEKEEAKKDQETKDVKDDQKDDIVMSTDAPHPDHQIKPNDEAGPSQPPPENDSRLKVNETYLQQLVDEMGFPKIRAQKALILTGNQSVEQAVEWCFQHADDADIDEPLQIVTSEGAPKSKLSPEEAKRKAEELYARARAKREEEDKIAAKEREKERLRSGKEVTAAKMKLEEEARKRAVAEKKREKREAMLQRQRVREMLEADKARRRQKFHMPGSPPTTPPAPAPEPSTEEKSEPSASAGKIQFRLPDGTRIEGEFQAEHTMGDLVTFLVSKRPELGVHALQFSQQYPRKTFSTNEYGVSLAELKLLPRGALTVSFS